MIFLEATIEDSCFEEVLVLKWKLLVGSRRGFVRFWERDSWQSIKMDREDGSSDTKSSCESPNMLASLIETNLSVDKLEFDWKGMPEKTFISVGENSTPD